MSEEQQGQMIYHYYGRLSWKKKRGNGYINNYKDIEFVSRAESIEQMNSDVGFMMQLMVHQGLTANSISDVKIAEVYKREEISRSFYYKEDEANDN
jgi:hypothetical protein